MQIRRLRAEDAEAAARLHHEGQQHTFLGRMGVPFLTALYRELAHSPWGFGVAATENQQVIGVATATSSTHALFRDLIGRRWWHLLGPTLAALGRHPSLVRSALETLSYPRKVGDPTPGEFEFLFYGVDAAWRGNRVASQLLEAITEECRQRGCRTLDSLVEEANELSAAIHIKRGFTLKKRVSLYGRAMAWYSLSLPPSNDWVPE